MSFQGATRTDPYVRVYAYGSSEGWMARERTQTAVDFTHTAKRWNMHLPAQSQEHVRLRR